MNLFDFQIKAVDSLSETFIDLWKTNNCKLELTFKAPTGAGKTVMMAEFLKTIDTNFQFNEDKAYLWISFSEDSCLQSMNKLYDYFNDGIDIPLKYYTDIPEMDVISKNTILFINWDKIKASNSESRKLRRDNEGTQDNIGVFDELIKKTLKERELILIIDEAHIQTDTELASEVINLINPRIVIRVTATPRAVPNVEEIQNMEKGYVFVKEEDVIKSGLIKNEIIIQNEDDIKKFKGQNVNIDEILLELAIEKHTELKEAYKQDGEEINPLVMIQLPSDMNSQSSEENKKDFVINYLQQKHGISRDKIAVWLDHQREEEKLRVIKDHHSDIDYLLFKLAPATGWDCPRAQILVMYREINSPTFQTQVIGRIKRMPNAHFYQNISLNKAYIFTNYNKNNIMESQPGSSSNKLPIYFTKIKDCIEPVTLNSVDHVRTKYNTLAPENSWQEHLISVFDKYFSTKDIMLDFSKNYNLAKDKINLDKRSIDNTIIVNASIESYDNFTKILKEKCNEINYSLSNNDIEKTYNLLCFKELQLQTKEEAKYNCARSWSPLKSALNVWFETRLNLLKKDYYPIIVNELLSETSELKKVIHKSLMSFRNVVNDGDNDKQERKIHNIPIPDKQVSFGEEYNLVSSVHNNDLNIDIAIKKNVYEYFYNFIEYRGKENEEKFIMYLEDNEKVLWWHKQKNSGQNEFSIEYFDDNLNKFRLFYPDFIVKTKTNKLYILDTKNGFTSNLDETDSKDLALKAWCEENKEKYDFEIIGATIEYQYPVWVDTITKEVLDF
ncbi:MAG: DEAD/DEAH box helicase family protein [Bacilli bacterium]|nr:DEAD/DEAH box helicase family protein [Bacilli bacterium]